MHYYSIATEELRSGYAGDGGVFGITSNTLIRVHPGWPAAQPTAVGLDEELLPRTAGVRLQWAARALQVIVQDGSMHHASPPVPIGNGVDGGRDLNHCNMD